MKRVNTFLCCALLCTFGAFVGINNKSSQTVTAATVDLNSIPYDLRPVRVLSDTIHDTIRVEVPKVVTKYKVKEVKVPYKDTLDIFIHFTYEGAKHGSFEPDSLPQKAL